MSVFVKALFRDPSGKGWSETMHAASPTLGRAAFAGTDAAPGPAANRRAARARLMAAGPNVARAVVLDDAAFKSALPVPVPRRVPGGEAGPTYDVDAAFSAGKADFAWTVVRVEGVGHGGLYQSRTGLSGISDNYLYGSEWRPDQAWLDAFANYRAVLVGGDTFGFQVQDKEAVPGTRFPVYGVRWQALPPPLPSVMVLTLDPADVFDMRLSGGEKLYVGRTERDGRGPGVNGVRQVAGANPAAGDPPPWLDPGEVAIADPLIPDYLYRGGGYVRLQAFKVVPFQDLYVTGVGRRMRGLGWSVGSGRARPALARV